MASVRYGKCVAPSDLGINYDTLITTTGTTGTYTTTNTSDCSITARWVLDQICDQMKKNYTTTGDISSLFIKDSNEFKTITEYVPNKVYGFTFYNGQEIKTVCDEEDEFNLEFAFYLAIAKKKLW